MRMRKRRKREEGKEAIVNELVRKVSMRGEKERGCVCVQEMKGVCV